MATSLDWKVIIDIHSNPTQGIAIKSGDGKLFTDALSIALYKYSKGKRYTIHLKKREFMWFTVQLREGKFDATYPLNRVDRHMTVRASQLYQGGIELHVFLPNRFEAGSHVLYFNPVERELLQSHAETAYKIIGFDPTVLNSLSSNSMSIALYKAWNNRLARFDMLFREDDYFQDSFSNLRVKIGQLIGVHLPAMPQLGQEYSETLNLNIPLENKLVCFAAFAETPFGELMEQLINYVIV